MTDSQLVNISGDIAYDWINKKIYFADPSQDKILFANTDGSDVVTILNVNYPRAIALHPCQGFSCFHYNFFLHSVEVLAYLAAWHLAGLQILFLRNHAVPFLLVGLLVGLDPKFLDNGPQPFLNGLHTSLLCGQAFKPTFENFSPHP